MCPIQFKMMDNLEMSCMKNLYVTSCCVSLKTVICICEHDNSGKSNNKGYLQ
jgi:hypothetical protein